jgi:hypothetical protein
MLLGLSIISLTAEQAKAQTYGWSASAKSHKHKHKTKRHVKHHPCHKSQVVWDTQAFWRQQEQNLGAGDGG